MARFTRQFFAMTSVLAAVGCLGPVPGPKPNDARPDGGNDAGTAVRFTVRDASGRAVDPMDAPLVPTIEAELSVRLMPADVVWLLAVAADEDMATLAEDFTKTPLRKATEARRVPAYVDFDDVRVRITPREPLARETAYAVAIAGWAKSDRGEPLGTPALEALRTSARADAGALLDGVWPSRGSVQVPRNLAHVALHFDGPVANLAGKFSMGREVTRKSTAPVAVIVETRPCEEVGWSEGTCLVATPTAPLWGRTRYRWTLAEGALDGSGAEMPMEQGIFDTSDTMATQLPAPVMLACRRDETPVSVGCLRVDDTALDLRAAFGEPVRVTAAVASRRRVLIAERGDVRLLMDALVPDSATTLAVEVANLAGHRSTFPITIQTQPALATVTITEVRPDPVGAEPGQEYVEVFNFGDVPTDLFGYTVSDHLDEEGDLITAHVVLPPRTAALVVPAGFDPAGAGDQAVPPGVALITLDDAIGAAGLKNGGEAVFLRDPEGHRLSGTPALPSPGAGACLVRRHVQTRDDLPASFHFDSAGRCTPGTVPDSP